MGWPNDGGGGTDFIDGMGLWIGPFDWIEDSII